MTGESGAEGRRELDERFADWVDGRLSPDEARRLEGEMAGDADLRRAAEDYRSTVALLQEHLDDEDPPADLVPEVMERLSRSNSRLRLLPAAASLAGLAAVVSLMVVFSGSDPDQPSTEQIAALDEDDATRKLQLPEESISNSPRQLGAGRGREVQTPPVVADLEDKNRDPISEAERAAELAKKAAVGEFAAGEKGAEGVAEVEEKTKAEAQNELADAKESGREDRSLMLRESEADAGVMLRQSWAVEQLARSILAADPPLAQVEAGQQNQGQREQDEGQEQQQAQSFERLLKDGVGQPGAATESEMPVLVLTVEPSELEDRLAELAGVVGGQRAVGGSDAARAGRQAGQAGRGARGGRGGGLRSRARAVQDEQASRSENLSSYLRSTARTQASVERLSRAQVVEIPEQGQVATEGGLQVGGGREVARTELRGAGRAGSTVDSPAGVAAPSSAPETSYQRRAGDQLFLVTGDVAQVRQLLVDVQDLMQAKKVDELAAGVSNRPQSRRPVQVQRVRAAQTPSRPPPADVRANEPVGPQLSFYVVLRPTK